MTSITVSRLSCGIFTLILIVLFGFSFLFFSSLGSGLNLLYRMDIDSKFNFIDQQANDNIVHSFKF